MCTSPPNLLENPCSHPVMAGKQGWSQADVPRGGISQRRCHNQKACLLHTHMPNFKQQENKEA